MFYVNIETIYKLYVNAVYQQNNYLKSLCNMKFRLAVLHKMKGEICNPYVNVSDVKREITCILYANVLHKQYEIKKCD